jgi:hypothetical protein
MALSLSICALSAFALVAASPFAAAAQFRPFSTARAQHHALSISCFDETGQRIVGAKTVRTSVLTSPDGLKRAFAEMRVEEGGTASCFHTAELFVSINNSPWESVFTQEPSLETGTASSMRLLAWSPNSRWLAVERQFASYYSEYSATALHLYDSSSGTVATPDLRIAIHKGTEEGCLLSYAILGFDAHNYLRLRVSDFQDENGVRYSNCAQRGPEWALDPASQGILPPDKLPYDEADESTPCSARPAQQSDPDPFKRPLANCGSDQPIENRGHKPRPKHAPEVQPLAHGR